MWLGAPAALLLLLALAEARPQDDATAELAQMLRDSCRAETGADLSPVAAVNAGADLPDAPDPKFKCYVKCVMETAGMLSDGAVDVEAVLAMLPPAVSARSAGPLRACGTSAGTDDCDVAYRTQQCWQRGNKKDYYLI